MLVGLSISHCNPLLPKLRFGGGSVAIPSGPSAMGWAIFSGTEPGSAAINIFAAPASLGDGAAAGDGLGVLTGVRVSIDGGAPTVYPPTLPIEIDLTGYAPGALVTATVQALGYGGRPGAVSFGSTTAGAGAPEMYLALASAGMTLSSAGLTLAVPVTEDMLSAPSGLSVMLTSDTGQEGATLTATLTGNLGLPMAAPVFTLTLDGDVVATGPAHTFLDAEVGDYQVSVAASNAYGEATATSNTLTIDAGWAPSGVSISVTPTSATAGDILTAAITVTDYGSPAGTLVRSWWCNGVEVPGETGPTLDTTDCAGSVECRATVTNVYGSASGTSNSVTVAPAVDAPNYDGLFTTQPANATIAMTYEAGAHFTGDGLSFSIDGSPAGWAIDPVTGTISRAPTAEGTESVTVRADNVAGTAARTDTNADGIFDAYEIAMGRSVGSLGPHAVICAAAQGIDARWNRHRQSTHQAYWLRTGSLD